MTSRGADAVVEATAYHRFRGEKAPAQICCFLSCSASVPVADRTPVPAGRAPLELPNLTGVHWCDKE